MRIPVTILFLFSYTFVQSQVTLSAGELRMTLTEKGYLSELKNTTSGKNYLFADTLSPLMTVVAGNARFYPTSLTYSKSQQQITLKYREVGVSIDIKVMEKATHLVLEIAKAAPESKIEAVIWGRFFTVIHKTVGEVIGVVRDGEVAVGIQVLNVKTLGGDLPNNEGSTWERGLAAKPYPWGSSLQAYSINRNRNRFVDAWGGQFKNMPVPALKGETVAGSKIALFSCAESQTLDRLEQIELEEKLPHPTIKGVWFKKSALFGKSYLISSFGAQDIDEMIAFTKRAGLFSLYHEGPFKSWGHFILDPKQFPNGKDDLKKCVDKAHAAGLFLGIHTLTNFINTNDPYVTPIPDDRLSVTGSSVLLKEVDPEQKEIEVASPEYFNEQKNNNLHTVKIGKELIRYQSVTDTKPYKLLDCQRGAFGTTASLHKAGDVVGKLFDHPYKVFFPNFEMQREVAKNLAALMHETGVDHLDFDGHEGGLASGEGDFAVDLFAKDVYENVGHDFVCGTSISKTFYWHIGSYYNWGEPWYGGFKESMQQYRIDNQGLFDRNYMPHMLGWYLLTGSTTLPEMEWMLARAAGYNAGFAMVARLNALRSNPLTPVLLDAIREWEMARTNNGFTQAQQERLKDPRNEFHLEKISEGKWDLYQYSVSPVFIHEKFERQPGEPTHSTWIQKQTWKEQPIQFRLNVVGKEGNVEGLMLQIDNYAEISLPISLKSGESLVCDGTEIIRLYDETGKPKGTYSLAVKPPVVGAGDHAIILNCTFEEEKEPLKVEVQFKGLDSRERVQIKE